MDDVVSRLAFQGATPATILQALEKGYAEGRFPFVPTRETISRLTNKKLRLYGIIAQRAGPQWTLPGPLPQRSKRSRGRGGNGNDAPDQDPDDEAARDQDRVALSALPAAAARGQWPDRETVRWWAYLAARAPDLPPEDLPDLVALWRARLAEGKPVRDLLLFVACAPWRGEGAFDDYVRAAARAGESLYPQWWGFLPTAARWLDEVVGDLSQIVAVLATGGPVQGPYDRAVDEREWQYYARDRWAAARASLVPLLPLVWRGLVSAAPSGDAPDAGAEAGAGVEAATAIPANDGGPVTENWFWRQTRRSDVLLAPPMTARTPVGRAWRWRSAAPATWTPLGPHEPVRLLLLSVCFDLARAVVALDQWAADGFPPLPMWEREPGPAQEPEQESIVHLFALRTRTASLAGHIALRAPLAVEGAEDAAETAANDMGEEAARQAIHARAGAPKMRLWERPPLTTRPPAREWDERALALLDPDEKATPTRLRHGITAPSSATPPTGADGGLGDERGRERER
jgi:hypothetical protein